MIPRYVVEIHERGRSGGEGGLPPLPDTATGE
jgi:hypothetical protein